MTEVLAIAGAAGYLAAIGALVYALVLRSRLADSEARGSRAIDEVAVRGALLDAAKADEVRHRAELARCREQKGTIYEANAKTGAAGGAAAVDDNLGELYQDPGDQDPGRHDG